MTDDARPAGAAPLPSPRSATLLRDLIVDVRFILDASPATRALMSQQATFTIAARYGAAAAADALAPEVALRDLKLALRKACELDTSLARGIVRAAITGYYGARRDD